ncbi:hypothetical protein F442_20490 [Phytophthora nicotianae P10297]|uniref:Uncharacterized protein n=1 Tax=Phytophthora nicotianae P10297 TaxID=1317064 RepID=W2Y6A7_PHYNI|nr:hypothetical protein F442_20490 [Phytophthora nicotianae P10297]
MSNNALRSENAALREQIQQMKGQLKASNRHIENQARNTRELIRTHHRERMLLLGGIGDRLDTMQELHIEVARRMNVLHNNRVTANPGGRKVHGFAVTITALDADRNYELRFIAGQQDYVERQTARTQPDEYLFQFTETGNPIDLRRNFQREASRRLQTRLAAFATQNPGAEPPNIIFRCCRSHWVESDFPFSLVEVKEILTNLIEATNAGAHLLQQLTELCTDVKSYMDEESLTL